MDLRAGFVLSTLDSDQDEVAIVILEFDQSTFVCLAAKSKGKGRYLNGAPRGWTVRRDPSGGSHDDAEGHWHCEKDGREIVITDTGYGSHKTQSGDPIPKNLGDYLRDTLGIPIKEIPNGGYVVRLVLQDFLHGENSTDLVSTLESLLNSRANPITD